MSIFEVLFGKKNLVGVTAPDIPEEVGAWLNSNPLKIKDLAKKGKVVLIDFWTYSCGNCLRTLPYLKSWYEKYSRVGLIIIGVHTPEFEFEKRKVNVESFIEKEQVPYPIVLDNDHRIWDLFKNKLRPRELLIDTKGKIRYDHCGEGAYAETENAIRELLKQSDPKVNLPKMAVQEHGHKVPSLVYPQTTETYCGYLRGRLGNPEGYVKDKFHVYKFPSKGPLKDGYIYLNGGWVTKTEYLQHGVNTKEPINFLLLPFHGLEANAVVRLDDTKMVSQTRVYVALDEKPLTKEMAGKDVLFDGGAWSYLKVEEPRMYQIFKTAEFGDHQLKIFPFSDAVCIYVFAFGGCTDS